METDRERENGREKEREERKRESVCVSLLATDQRHALWERQFTSGILVCGGTTTGGGALLFSETRHDLIDLQQHACSLCYVDMHTCNKCRQHQRNTGTTESIKAHPIGRQCGTFLLSLSRNMEQTSMAVLKVCVLTAYVSHTPISFISATTPFSPSIPKVLLPAACLA